MALEVAIIGAGIAGLSAAIALRRAGHNIALYERSSFKQEIGAAITLTPNANLVLDHWGFDAKKAGETPKHQSRRLNTQTLECICRVELSDVHCKFGHAFNAFHRVDLHDGLKEIAMKEGDGEVPKLHLSQEVIALDCETGVLTFQDGTEATKDLVVIADGCRSRFIETITGQDIPFQKRGKSIYRTLIPMERLLADPLVRPLFENEPSGFVTAMNFQTWVVFICYPCRDDEVMNMAVFHNTKSDEFEKEDWNSPATVQDVVDELNKGGFHPAWEAFTRNADEMRCYTIGVRDVLPRFHRGKAVLIGDAAHPMQPTYAQGGTTAIEDAAALEIFFSPARFNASTDTVSDHLEIYGKLRMPRDCVTQIMSNAMFYSARGDNALTKVREYYAGPVPASTAEAWSEPIQDFFYGYDAFKEAEKALRWKESYGQHSEEEIEHFGL